MPDAPEALVGVEVSPVGKYLLCALAGFTVGAVLGVTLARLIAQVDSLPPDATITPIRSRATTITPIRPRATTVVDEPDDAPDEVKTPVKLPLDDPEE